MVWAKPKFIWEDVDRHGNVRGDVEALVLDRLRVFFSSRIDVSDAVAPLDLEAHPLDAALRNASKLSERWLAAPPVVMKSLVREIVEQITVAADRIEIRLSRAKIAVALEAEGASQRPDLDPVVVSIEAKLRRAGKGKRLIIGNGAGARQRRLRRTDQRSFRDPKSIVVCQYRGIERKGRLTSCLVVLSRP